MCGEHVLFSFSLLTGGGSSPHVRGTLCQVPRTLHTYRFIPACAGNTLADLLKGRRSSVHPRMCGEHMRSKVRVLSHFGSSPHVRGTPDIIFLNARERRFIPACAGNTGPAHSIDKYLPVHPRMCGEHKYQRAAVGAVVGSSPHVRGTPIWPRLCQGPHRFIPACAGNTRF